MSQGADCSGLVQTAMRLAGRPAPRDSDMLEAWAGEPLPIDERLALARPTSLTSVSLDGAVVLLWSVNV